MEKHKYFEIGPEDMNLEEGQFAALNQVQSLYIMPYRIKREREIKHTPFWENIASY